MREALKVRFLFGRHEIGIMLHSPAEWAAAIMDNHQGKTRHQLTAQDTAELPGVNVGSGLSEKGVLRRRSEFGRIAVTVRRGPPAWLDGIGNAREAESRDSSPSG